MYSRNTIFTQSKWINIHFFTITYLIPIKLYVAWNKVSQNIKLFSEKLANVEKKNSLLTENLDLDYLETIYRKKFMIGKSNEKVYTNY